MSHDRTLGDRIAQLGDSVDRLIAALRAQRMRYEIIRDMRVSDCDEPEAVDVSTRSVPNRAGNSE